MHKKLLFTLLTLGALALCLGGCGYKEGTIAPDQKAYLWFTGKTEGLTAFIDEQGPIDLGPHYYTDQMGNKKAKTTDIHYEIAPGKHRIKLIRDNTIIVERIILVGSGMTKEIIIP